MPNRPSSPASVIRRRRWVRTALLAACLPAAVMGTAAEGSTSGLLPVPRSVQEGAGPLMAVGPMRVIWSGYRNALLTRAVARFSGRVAGETGAAGHPSGAPIPLIIDCAFDDAAFLTLEQKEGYRLVVDASGIRLHAEGAEGILQGLATLEQDIVATPDGPRIAPISVDDAPRFHWRGVMIDVARHFMSLASLKRQIDAMAQVKLNVLHLHLSDNEGFRVESRLYPRLQTVGSHGQFYTQDEVRDLVRYARDRGVRIVPEFDVPGHTLAMLTAYPEYASGPLAGANYLSAMNSALNPADPATFAFLDRLFGEMADLFPDRYFHVGGDEVTGTHWSENPSIQAFAKQNGFTGKVELEGYFHRRLAELLRRRGRIVMGWEEIRVGLKDPATLVQTWRGSGSIAKATAAGQPVIVSAGYYLDLLEPAVAAYRVDPEDPAASGMSPEEASAARKNPIFGPRLVDEMIRNPALTLTQAQKGLIRGGEAALWSELVTDEMLDQRLWPRAAAVAERLWSPAEVVDPADLERRLEIRQTRLRRAGLLDEVHRRAMIARLAPGDEGTVETLLEAVAPVRNHAHNHLLRSLINFRPASPQAFDQLADIAAPDSFAGWRFERAVTALTGGDRTAAARIRTDLLRWRDNETAFRTAAQRNPALTDAVPVAVDIAELSRQGLEALDAIEQGRALTAQGSSRADALLQRQTVANRASATMIAGLTAPRQPPADVLITIAPAIQQLISAASKR